MRPAQALSPTSADATSSYGKLIAEAPTEKPPAAATTVNGWLMLVFGVLTLGGAAATAAGGAPLPVYAFLAVCGVPLVAGGAWKLKKHAARRGVLRVFERGVALQSSDGILRATLEELEGVGLEEKELLVNGAHNGWLRTLTLWKKGQTSTLESHIRGGAGDAFGTALDALIKLEADQTARSLAGGEVLHGEGWQLDRNGLKLQGGLITPLESFVQTGVNEGRAQAWRRGEEEPFFNVKVGSRNARTALGVIARHLPKDDSARVVPGLGRRLFSRGMSSGARKFFAALALFFAAPAVLGFLFTLEPGALLGLLFGGLFGVIWWGGAKGGTHIHERGVRQTRVFGGRKELKFSEVEVYTHGTTRHFYNGAYTGTSHRLEFLPLNKSAKKITFNFMARGTDEDTEKLRDRMARIVAQSMYQRVMAGARVRWAGAELARDGIHYNEAKLFGKGAAQVLAYAGSRYTFDQGQCFLYPATGNKHATALSCAGQNFFPGFELYQMLCTEAQSRA